MAGSKDDDDYDMDQLDLALDEIQDKVGSFNSGLSDQSCCSKWSVDQRENMKACYKYGLDVIDFVKKCWIQGPTKEQFPISPEISFADCSRMTNKKSEVRVVVKKQTKNRTENVSVNNMNATEFDLYLKSRLCVQKDELLDNFSKMNSMNDLKDAAVLLNEKMKYINLLDARCLIKHIEFGNYLMAAKDLFRREKKKYRLKQSWESWVAEHIRISPSYVRQHKEVAILCESYRKLRNLAMTFTELCRLKNKIRKIFSTNESIANYLRDQVNETADIEMLGEPESLE